MDDELADRVRFTFSPRPEHVSLARMLVAALARRHGFGEATIEDVRLLVSEACTNAVEAHMRLADMSPVTVTCELDGDLAIEIADLGGGLGDFDPAQMALPLLDEGDGKGEDGYGIPLMHIIADQVSFTVNELGGTTVRLGIAKPRPDQGEV